MTNEYVAGFFDGEGSITLTRNGQARVCIVQKDDAVLRLIQAMFGGTVIKRRPSEIGGYSHALNFTKKEVMLTFLRAIQPYCIVKRGQVETAIKFIELTQSNGFRRQAANGRFLSSGNFPERDLLRNEFYKQ